MKRYAAMARNPKGSSNMKKNMLELEKPVYEVILRTHNTNE